MKNDEIVLAFCNYKTKEELDLPGDVAVCTDLIEDDRVYVVSKAEFLEWLEQGGQELMS